MAASIVEQLTGAIAQRLEISPADARALIDRGPFVAGEALDTRLVDALGYRDEVYAAVRRERPATTRICSTWGATSAPGRWASGRGNCRALTGTASG